MGTSTSFQEYGRDFDNTVSYSDLVSLALIKIKPVRITHIRFWIDDYIVGFEWFYDGLSAGARFGSGFKKSLFTDIVLDANEIVTQISGTSAEVIDTITFWTSFGRQFTVGKYRGGKNFILSWPRKVVIGFKVGFGKFLHKIGVFFGKPKGCRKMRRTYSNSHVSIPRYNNIYNQGFVQNSHLSQQPHRQIVNESHVFREEPNTASSHRRPARMHNHYAPYSPHSNREDDTSSTSSHAADAFRAREAITTRTRRWQSVIERGRDLSNYNIFDTQEEQKTPFSPKKLHPCGMRYSNTILFDDYESLAKEGTNVTMKQIRIIHDNHYVYGVQGVYEVDSKIWATNPHWLPNVPPFAINEAIMLADGESITSIEGTFVDVINGIKITTSKGLVYNFGVVDFNLPYVRSFKVTVPYGKQAIAIYGGFSSYLHNISLYYA